MPKAAMKFDSDIGHHFGKSNLERIGLFAELGYMNGKGYFSPFTNQMCTWRSEGCQLPGYPKSKCGTQEWNLPGRTYSYVAPGTTKEHSCPRDFYGTFGGKVEGFSPELKHKPPYKKQAPNLLTNPGKKGGLRYADITLSKYLEHRPGGCKDGCFNKRPEQSEDKYLSEVESVHDKYHKTGKVFYPQAQSGPDRPVPL